jgi:hypothetical protein
MNNPLGMAGATVVIAAEKGMPHRQSLRLLLAGAFFLLALLWCLVSSGSF